MRAEKKRRRPTLCIAGGGAAGLAAAIEASRTFRQAGAPGSVTILERLPRVGKKLLATGNGRCNLTNRRAAPGDYFEAAEFVRPALSRFSVEDTLAFFASMGLLCEEEEEGRIYPMSRQAASVLDALRLEAERLGVAFQCDKKVDSIQKIENGWETPSFLLNGVFLADAVILACGGKAAPQHGSDGSGYALLREQGIPVTRVAPSLVQLTTVPGPVKALKGMRVRGEIALYAGERKIAVQRGEIQFTEYGLSGIAAMQLSRLLAREKGARMDAVIDLLPSFSKKQASEYLEERIQHAPALVAEHLLTGILPKRVGQALLKQAGIAPLTRPIGSLLPEERAPLAAMLKEWRLPLTGTRGFADAQVTTGGAQRSAFSPDTMESLAVPGLYAAGELLDVDAGCGGFNLQWAWSSGRLAGWSAAQNLINRMDLLKQGVDV